MCYLAALRLSNFNHVEPGLRKASAPGKVTFARLVLGNDPYCVLALRLELTNLNVSSHPG